MKIIRTFEIPVCYSVTGRVTIKAESVEDARQKCTLYGEKTGEMLSTYPSLRKAYDHALYLDKVLKY